MQSKSIFQTNGRLYSMIIASALTMVTLPSFAENNFAVQNVQQDAKVKGQVTDVNGEPIIGATVTLKGTNKRAVTDLDGNYWKLPISYLASYFKNPEVYKKIKELIKGLMSVNMGIVEKRGFKKDVHKLKKIFKYITPPILLNFAMLCAEGR